VQTVRAAWRDVRLGGSRKRHRRSPIGKSEGSTLGASCSSSDGERVGVACRPPTCRERRRSPLEECLRCPGAPAIASRGGRRPATTRRPLRAASRMCLGGCSPLRDEKPVAFGGRASPARSGSDMLESRADPRKPCRRCPFGGVTPPRRCVGHACRRGDPSTAVCRRYPGRGVTPPRRYVGHASAWG